jgi:indolepyruvate ferredoxin oxidoreductase beta subunit
MMKNILIVGVGGQGSLLATRIVGHAALILGYDVKVSEVHGMSQRGGAVVTYARYGDAGEKVHSPVICRGEADMIISFEQLESLRWISYLKKGGVLMTSTQKINPLPVIVGAMAYPEDILGGLEAAGIKVVPVDAFGIAVKAGNEKTANVAMMGAFAKLMNGESGMTKEICLEALRKSISEISDTLLGVNVKAFELGYEHASV